MKSLLLALLLLPVLAQAEGGLPTQPYIYVLGKAEVEKPADLVTVSFQLGARDHDQVKANHQVQTQAAKVFGLLKSMNVADKDVLASDLKSEAEYGDPDEKTQRRGPFLGYHLTRPFSVKVREIGIFPKLVDSLLALQPEEFSGIEEGLSEAKQLEEQVWDKAVANARERAEKTLKAAGMKADSVFAISPVAFPEIERQIFGGNEPGGLPAASMSAATPKEVTSEYRLAPVKVSQEVHVIFLISPAK